MESWHSKPNTKIVEELPTVEELVFSLQSSTTQIVLGSLDDLKIQVLNTTAGVRRVRELGGLNQMVALLRKPNEKILDMTLSALGCCCMNEEDRLAFRKLNIFSPLVTIMNNITRDSIRGRACRIVGNLAQTLCLAEKLHEAGAVSGLITVIEDNEKKATYPSLTLAVRALRLLWMVTDKREEMLSKSAVRAVAKLLILECESLDLVKPLDNKTTVSYDRGCEESRNFLFTGLLKCMGYFTTMSTTECVDQIQCDGRGFQCLVALSKTFQANALSCLINLCWVSSFRPVLGASGAVDCIVNILKRTRNPDMWPDGGTRALSLLSREAVNRARVRLSGGLPLLVEAARSQLEALNALLLYVFDETSFQVLIDEGLVEMLTEELQQYVNSMRNEHNVAGKDPRSCKWKSMVCDGHVTALGLIEDSKAIEDLTAMVLAEEAQTPNIQPKSDNPKPLRSKRRTGLEKKALEQEKAYRKRMQSKMKRKLKIRSGNTLSGLSDSEDEPSEQGAKKRKVENKPEQCSADNSKTRAYSKASISPNVREQSPLCLLASSSAQAGNLPQSRRPGGPWDWSPESPKAGGSWDWSPDALATRRAWSPEAVATRRALSPEALAARRAWSPDSVGHRRAWSPDGGESSAASPKWQDVAWSPGSSSSNCNSPHSVQAYCEDESVSEESGHYSPVCTDEENEEEGEAGGTGGVEECTAVPLDADFTATQMTQDLDDLIMDDDDDLAQDLPLPGERERPTAESRLACTMVLLSRVSHACSPSADQTRNFYGVELLSNKTFLITLSIYLEKCRRPLGRPARILARIVSNATCLLSMLRIRFVLRLRDMAYTPLHPAHKCKQCRQLVNLSKKLIAQLSMLAQSDYGLGVVAHNLCKGNDDLKHTLCVTLPYLLNRSDKSSKVYYLNCKVLDYLYHCLTTGERSGDDCILALAHLAVNMKVKDSKLLENHYKRNNTIIYDQALILDKLTPEEIVTFTLDDGSTVSANRQFLCEKSEFFCAMLEGQFKESVESCVRLPKVSKGALEYMLALLHFGMDQTKCKIDVFPLAPELEDNLELLLLADRFLLNNLKRRLLSAVIQFKLNPLNFNKIYIWSLTDGMGFLCVESVAYLLTGSMSDKERIATFRSMLDTEYRQQLMDDIKTMITRQLK